jgi:hypothetical protein
VELVVVVLVEKVQIQVILEILQELLEQHSLGGGGGAGSPNPTGSNQLGGGLGGSGIVIIAYPS